MIVPGELRHNEKDRDDGVPRRVGSGTEGLTLRAGSWRRRQSNIIRLFMLQIAEGVLPYKGARLDIVRVESDHRPAA